MNSKDDPITRAFIGHAMKVHSSIGPGLGEEIYHQDLARRLSAAGIPHLSKPRRDLVYKGIVADTFEPDFVIDDHFIPELKVLRGEFSREHMVQIFCYCKYWRLRTSLLVDFGKQSLLWKRLMYPSFAARIPSKPRPSFVSQPELAETILGAVDTCLQEVGLGYRETSWRGLVGAAVQAAGCTVCSVPRTVVLGQSGVPLSCLVVENACAVEVVALTDGITAADRARLQTQLRWLGLDWGIVLHFGKRDADLCFVKSPSK